jgi:hypothetical protein
MRTTKIFLHVLLMLSLSLSPSWASSRSEPIILKRIALTDLKAEVSAAVIFVSPDTGIYRITAYGAVVKAIPFDPYVPPMWINGAVAWTDASGVARAETVLIAPNGAPLAFNDPAFEIAQHTTVVTIKAKSNLVFETRIDPSYTTGGVYQVYFVIERLW